MKKNGFKKKHEQKEIVGNFIILFFLKASLPLLEWFIALRWVTGWLLLILRRLLTEALLLRLNAIHLRLLLTVHLRLCLTVHLRLCLTVWLWLHALLWHNRSRYCLDCGHSGHTSRTNRHAARCSLLLFTDNDRNDHYDGCAAANKDDRSDYRSHKCARVQLKSKNNYKNREIEHQSQKWLFSFRKT